MTRKYLYLFFVLTAVLVTGILSGCGTQIPPYRLSYEKALSSEDKKEITLKNFTSDNKEELHSFKFRPKRIIAVGEAAAETLLRLGQEKYLVAVVDVVENGAELKERFPGFNKNGKCKILNRPGIETLMMLQPDLIVGWASNFTMKRYGSTDFWSDHGADVYIAASSMPIYRTKNIEMELQYISDMGHIFGCEAEADTITGGLRDEIANCKKQLGEKPPRVMVLALSRGLIINYGTGTLPGNIVELSGGRVISSDRYLSAEELINMNPDVIFIVRLDRRLDVGVKMLAHNPKFRTLDCIAQGNVHGIPVHWVYNSGINAGNAVKQIVRCLIQAGEAYTSQRL